MAAAGLGLLLLGGCASEDNPLSPRSSAAAHPYPPSATASPITVPDVAGLSAQEARVAIRAAGLLPEVRQQLGTACRLRGAIDQRPAAGSLAQPGSEVVVDVNLGGSGHCGLDLPAPSDDLRRLARAFIAFARDTGSPPPMSEVVALHLGHRLIASRVRAELRDSGAGWRICPPEGAYAAWSCPFSGPWHVRNAEGPLAVTSAPAAHLCLAQADRPPGLAGMDRVTITPDELTSCLSYWAIELYVTGAGRIAAVDVLRSEP